MNLKIINRDNITMEVEPELILSSVETVKVNGTIMTFTENVALIYTNRAEIYVRVEESNIGQAIDQIHNNDKAAVFVEDFILGDADSSSWKGFFARMTTKSNSRLEQAISDMSGYGG